MPVIRALVQRTMERDEANAAYGRMCVVAGGLLLILFGAIGAIIALAVAK